MNTFNGIWRPQCGEPFIINIFGADNFLFLEQDYSGIAREWGTIHIQEKGCFEDMLCLVDVFFKTDDGDGVKSGLSNNFNGRWQYYKTNFTGQEIAEIDTNYVKLIRCSEIWY